MSLCRDRELVGRWEKQKEAMKKLQLCVAFGGKVKQFRLAIPGRLLIHEGEITLIERRKRKKVCPSFIPCTPSLLSTYISLCI